MLIKTGNLTLSPVEVETILEEKQIPDRILVQYPDITLAELVQIAQTSLENG